MDNPIIFFDSGIGGVPYLTYLRNQIPGEDFIYIADSKNFPYGEKDEETLKIDVLNIVKGVIDKFDPKVVVIACNTASVTLLNDVRDYSDIPIVGVVPAIKTASENTRNGKVGILATKRTVEGDYLKGLIKEFSSGIEVFSVGASGIVDFVENRLLNSTLNERRLFIAESVNMMKEYGVDSVVLGCTHFIHVTEDIKEFLGEKVEVIDSREGVSRQVHRVIELNRPGNIKMGIGEFYMTDLKDNYYNYKELCEKENLEFKGEFIVD